MRALGPIFATICLLLLVGVAHAVPTEYAVDDLGSEISLGHGTNGDFMWGNYFTVVGGADLLLQVELAFSSDNVAVGRDFTVVIYDDVDDDGNPTAGLTLLTSVAGTVQNPQTVGANVLEVVDIPDTTVAGGFFVAVYMDGTGNPFPALFDQSSESGNSWFAEHNTSGSLNLNDPFGSATLSGEPGSFAFPGNFIVRATAVPEPGTALLLATGLVGISMRRRLQKAPLNS